MCSGCYSLGHTVGACPYVSCSWVQKPKPVEAEAVKVSTAIDHSTVAPKVVLLVAHENLSSETTKSQAAVKTSSKENEWKTVLGKSQKHLLLLQKCFMDLLLVCLVSTLSLVPCLKLNIVVKRRGLKRPRGKVPHPNFVPDGFLFLQYKRAE